MKRILLPMISHHRGLWFFRQCGFSFFRQCGLWFFRQCGFWLIARARALTLATLVGTALGVAALSSGCVYRINIQQGNFLDQAAVEQVKPGMTRSQVRYLLGTPMVADSFNKERWDYIYYLKKGRTRHVDSRRVTVYFDGDKVARLDKPTAAEAAAQAASAAQLKPGRTY